MNVLPFEMRVKIASMVVEGMSLRGTSRVTKVHRDTIQRWITEAGEACTRLHDALVRDVRPALMQFDEQWCFVGKKDAHKKDGDPAEYGSWWTWVALDAVGKLVVSYRVDQRTLDAACAFAADTRARVLGRPQITTDGFNAYPEAIEQAFGCEVDYAMAIKRYDEAGLGEAARRYSPGRLIEVEKKVIAGAPAEEYISTSFSERFNLNTRMNSRRFARLTNAFSKRVRPLRGAVALTFAFYNFCRVHGTLRVTPAMETGLTDHVWSMEELLTAALATPMDQQPPTVPSPIVIPRAAQASGKPGTARTTPVFRVIDGGLAGRRK